MKIVVTGGSGFLGSHIANRLAAESGHEVTVVSRGYRPLPHHRHVVRDLYSATDLRPVLEGADACIHLASDLVPATAEKAGAAGLVRNLELADRVAGACIDSGVSRLLFASSGGTVYGRDVEAATESMPCRPIGLYGAQKVAIEALLRARLASARCRATILRIANPYGAGQEAQPAHGVIGRMLRCLVNGDPFTVWGDGTQIRDYIWVGDVAEAVVAALAYEGRQDVFNVGSGMGVSMAELIGLCEQVTGGRLARSYAPHPGYDVDRISLDISLAAAELDWRPRVPLMQGLRNYYSQIKEHR